VAADLACEVEVAAGDTADVMAGERDNHVGVRELNVGVVVGGLGRGTDLVDQREAGSEVAGAEPSLDASKDLPPVRETGVAYLRPDNFSRGSVMLSLRLV